MMKLMSSFIWKKDKVLNAIIQFVKVNMVNFFFTTQRSANMVFHNKSMFSNITTMFSAMVIRAINVAITTYSYFATFPRRTFIAYKPLFNFGGTHLCFRGWATRFVNIPRSKAFLKLSSFRKVLTFHPGNHYCFTNRVHRDTSFTYQRTVFLSTCFDTMIRSIKLFATNFADCKHNYLLKVKRLFSACLETTVKLLTLTRSRVKDIKNLLSLSIISIARKQYFGNLKLGVI